MIESSNTLNYAVQTLPGASTVGSNRRVDALAFAETRPIVNEPLSAAGTTVAMPQAVITDEMLDRMRALAGTRMRIDHSVNNEEATRIAITKFAGAIGDANELWTHDARAAASPYRRPVAPPSWVIAAFSGIQFGWPGLGAFHCDSTLRFYLPIYRGDRIRAECVYDGFEGPKAATFAPQIVVDAFSNRYYNQDDRLVADIAWRVINFERSAAGMSEDGAAAQVPHPWTEEELREIEVDVLAEAARGSEPHYWDDVAVGDELNSVTKGPIGVTDEIAFVAAGGAPIPRLVAHGVALRLYRRQPAWAFRDPSTGALEPIYAVHYNHQAARAMGVISAYDVGFQRQCWHTHLLTDWMSDHGWVKRSYASYRGFVYLGDVVRLGGRVTDKYIDADGEHIVDVETWARNQRGEDVMPGTATIALPDRAGTTEPVTARLYGVGAASSR